LKAGKVTGPLSPPQPEYHLRDKLNGMCRYPRQTRSPKRIISRQEYMKLMKTEFDRLDKEKKGELDAKKLAQSNLSATTYVGK
jgi:hypothetical protein